MKKWLRVNEGKIKNININFSWPQLIFSTLMMILAQYGSLLIAASCESGIKSHFYGTFNKPQWLFIEKQSTMGSKPLKSSCIFKVGIFWEGHKIWKNLPLKIWRYWVSSNFKWKIFSNCMAFSEYPNFTVVVT